MKNGFHGTSSIYYTVGRYSAVTILLLWNAYIAWLGIPGGFIVLDIGLEEYLRFQLLMFAPAFVGSVHVVVWIGAYGGLHRRNRVRQTSLVLNTALGVFFVIMFVTHMWIYWSGLLHGGIRGIIGIDTKWAAMVLGMALGNWFAIYKKI